MIIGIGMDIVELQRMEEKLARNPRLSEKILTENEYAVFKNLSFKRQVEFLAGRFAAKEAYAKAVGTGIGAQISLQDIEVATDELGKPFIKEPQSEGVHLTITHSSQNALAQVIIEKVT
ncbi:holo-ACP synthase [Bacillus kwashiorkori]|uniref:holo-ACP synthase n=1 Tax=Bacillus kwashiorkori TaxID=1522318 RepID=UPI0007819EFE|nr:holo-ACP synthase [Bacillus kwashiorkori]